MLSSIEKATITTSFIIIVHILLRTKFTKWLIAFFIFFFFMNYYLESTEYDEDYFEPIGWEYFDRDVVLTPQQRAEFVEKMNFHEANAKRTYEDAKARCWWLPNVTDRANARHCFGVLMLSFTASNPQSKAIIMLLAALERYGAAVMDEWDYIENKLNWSKFHYEMKEFYEHILING